MFALAPQQRISCAVGDEHAQAAAFLHQLLVHQFLVRLGNGEWVDLVVGRDLADRGQGVALVQRAVQDHRHHAFAELAVDRDVVVPGYAHGFNPGGDGAVAASFAGPLQDRITHRLRWTRTSSTAWSRWPGRRGPKPSRPSRPACAVREALRWKA